MCNNTLSESPAPSIVDLTVEKVYRRHHEKRINVDFSNQDL